MIIKTSNSFFRLSEFLDNYAERIQKSIFNVYVAAAMPHKLPSKSFCIYSNFCSFVRSVLLLFTKSFTKPFVDAALSAWSTVLRYTRTVIRSLADDETADVTDMCAALVGVGGGGRGGELFRWLMLFRPLAFDVINAEFVATKSTASY